jgi:hypothetical protein
MAVPNPETAEAVKVTFMVYVDPDPVTEEIVAVAIFPVREVENELAVTPETDLSNVAV